MFCSTSEEYAYFMTLYMTEVVWDVCCLIGVASLKMYGMFYYYAEYISHLKLYSHLKEEAQNRTMWRNHFGRGIGPVIR